MMKVLILLSALAVVAMAQIDVAAPPMPYTFEWGVKDDVTLNDYAQQAASDGNVATGTYRVLLPDGRVQTVAYKADAVNGYIADVTYN